MRREREVNKEKEKVDANKEKTDKQKQWNVSPFPSNTLLTSALLSNSNAGENSPSPSTKPTTQIETPPCKSKTSTQGLERCHCPS